MAHVDIQYNNLAKTVLQKGYTYEDRSRDNIKMIEIPSYTLEIDPTKGFPLLTTKRIFWKSIFHELIWMLSGSENINYLLDNGVNIWRQDAFNFSGGTHVGRIYGAQWRAWRGRYEIIDQIKALLHELKKDLYSRRHLVTAWNPAELHNMALPPCHWAFQVFPTREGFGIKWQQRSCDVFLGIPFDIGLYALLGRLISREIKKTFTHLIGDLTCVHFYTPHVPLIEKQLSRDIIDNEAYLTIDPEADLFNLHIDNFNIINYEHHGPIKAKMYAKTINNYGKTEIR